MKNILSLAFCLLAFGASTLASASEQNLACILDQPQSPSGFEIRQVIVGESQDPVALQRSSEHGAQIVHFSKYAVVITLIPGDDDGGATQEFYTLGETEFSLRRSNAGLYFSDRLNGFTALCDLNREVFANPAVSRGN